MSATKKFTITIEQVKRDIHHMTLEGENVMEALDAAREMVKQRNKVSEKTGNVFAVTKIEEVKDE